MEETNNKQITKKPNIAIIIGIIIVLIAICGTIFAINLKKRDPLNRLILGCMKMYDQRQQRYIVTASLALDKNNKEVKALFEQIPEDTFKSNNAQIMDFISQILSKTALKYSIIMDTEGSPICAGANFSLNYDNKELADASCVIRPFEATLNSKAFLDKPFYIDLSKAANESLGVDISKLNIKEYLDVLYDKNHEYAKKIAIDKYFQVLKTDLKDKLKSEGSNKIILEYNYAELLKLYQDLLTVAIKDEGLKELTIHKLEKIAEVVIKNGDYKLMNLSKEEFSSLVNNTKKELSNNWQDALSQATKVYSDMLQSSEYEEYMKQFEKMPFKYTFTFKGDKIEQIDVELLVEGISVNYNIASENYNMDGFIFADKDNSNNLEDLKSYNQMLLLNSFMSKAKDILNSDAFKNMKEDIINIAKKTLEKEDVINIESAFDNILNMANMASN